MLHELALGQRDGRERLLEDGVDEHAGVGGRGVEKLPGRDQVALVLERRRVALDPPRQDQHVLVGLGAVADGPPHRVEVVRVDVVVHRDGNLADAVLVVGDAVEGAPHVPFRGLAHLHDDELAQVGEGFVHGHLGDALDAHGVPQVAAQERLVAHLLDDARLARGHLADERAQHGLALHGDGGHLHERRHRARVQVAVGFAEGSLGLHEVGVDEPFDDDLGVGRHFDVHGLAAHQLDGLPPQAAGDAHLVHARRHLLDGAVGNHRRRPHHQRRVQRLAALPALVPVREDVLVHAGVHAHALLALDLSAVVALVADTRLRVPGEPVGAGGVRGVVEPRRGDGHRELEQAAALDVEVGTLKHHLVHRPGIDDGGLDGIRQCVRPKLRDLVHRAPQSHRVDLRRRRQRGHSHGHVVGASVAVHHVLEQECLALRLGQTAAELPAHQRVHFRVLVDGVADTYQQSGRLQVGQVLLKVGIGHGRGRALYRMRVVSIGVASAPAPTRRCRRDAALPGKAPALPAPAGRSW